MKLSVQLQCLKFGNLHEEEDPLLLMMKIIHFMLMDLDCTDTRM